MQGKGYFGASFGWWQWPLCLIGLSAIAGSFCAGFLLLLEWAQQSRHHFPWMIFLLPLAGMLIVWLYQRWGSAASGGGPAKLYRRRRAKPPVARRITPLIILTTALTAFGGSAEREGTAVQMGAGIGASVARVTPQRKARHHSHLGGDWHGSRIFRAFPRRGRRSSLP